MRTQIVRGVAAGLAVLLGLVSSPGLSVAQGEKSGPQTHLVGVVNVNTASGEELELLPGIGPARARALIEHRKQHGPFKRVEDLAEVSGIGAKAIDRIRSYCVLAGKTTARLEQD